MTTRAHWEDAVNAAARMLSRLEQQPWYPRERSRIRPFLETEMDNEGAKMLIARMNYRWRRTALRGWAPIERGK